MSKIHELLEQLRDAGIELQEDNGNLIYHAPKGRMNKFFIEEIKKNKTEIIAYLRSSALDINLEPITKAGNLPLSFSQQRLWFFHQLMGGSTFYNICGGMHIKGELNRKALNQSVQALVNNHENLRTNFYEGKDQPFQVISEERQIKITETDLRSLPDAEKRKTASKITTRESLTNFDLSNDHLIRFHLVIMNDQEFILCICIHHIIADNWSLRLLIGQLWQNYSQYKQGIPLSSEKLTLQYVDYSHWQEKQYLSGGYDKQLQFWKERLKDIPSGIELPTDRERLSFPTFQGGSHSLSIPKELTESIYRFCKEQGITLFMLLLSALQILLYRYSGQDDIVVGAPVANRQRKEMEGVIGFFANMLSYRTNLSGNLSFLDVIHKVKTDSLDIYENQDFPFEKLVEELIPHGDASKNPVFQIVLQTQKEVKEESQIADLTIHPFKVEHGTVRFDLEFLALEGKDQITLEIDYSKDLFELETITQISRRFLQLLSSAMSNPSEKIEDISILDDVDIELMLEKWNGNIKQYPEVPVPQLFEKQAELDPDRLAVSDRFGGLTYGELNRQANQLAHYLIEKGVGKGTKVSLYFERSLPMITATMAVLKTGATYIPLDPAFPSERNVTILKESNADMLLTISWLAMDLGAFEGPVFQLDEISHNLDQYPISNPNIHIGTDQVAYIIYTSGSTGTPKGVVIPHKGLLNLICWHQSAFHLTKEDRGAQLNGIAFDGTVWEVFPYLTLGASVHLIPPGTIQSPEGLQQWLIDTEITHTFITTAIAVELFKLHWPDKVPLKYLLTGGEKLHQYPKALPFRIINNYGPTENSAITTWIELTEDEQEKRKLPAIGYPLPNVRLYVLDQKRKPVPIGVKGELYIGGQSVGYGYLNRPELTAEKFLPDPFVDDPTATMYRTGDIVRYHHDGVVEYVERVDNQVKVRGFRIELSEIENVLTKHALIEEAVVIVIGDNNNKRIAAYVKLKRGYSLSTGEIRIHLKGSLPEYMIPTAFVFMDSFPITPNGKVDKRALPLPEAQSRPDLEAEYVAPRTEAEEKLSKIWEELLGVKRVGVFDNFFEMGGHSILAMRVMSHVRVAFHTNLPLRSMFEIPTIAQLASEIERVVNKEEAIEVPSLQRVDREKSLPLSFAQHRLWLFEEMNTGSAVYNVPAAIRFKGNLNVKALQQSLNEIVRRHETLQTTFHKREGESWMQINADTVLSFQHFDLISVPEERKQSVLKKMIDEEAQQPFDLRKAPLMRCLLFHMEDDHHILLLNMHHIVTDGWSIGVLIKELTLLYDAYIQEKPSPLPELEIQYADFSVWQREWLKGNELDLQLEYWLKQLDGELPVLDLPIDRPRPAIQTYRGSTVKRSLPQELINHLKRWSKNQEATLFFTMLAAFKVWVYRYTGQKELIIGTPISNRSRPDLEHLIGFFVNMLPLRTELTGELSFSEYVNQVKEICLQAYDHQDLPFEKMVERLKLDRDLSRSPIIQVLFALHNTPMSKLELTNLTAEQIDVETGTAKFDLTLNVVDLESARLNEEQTILVCEYNSDLFYNTTVERFMDSYICLLQAIAENPEIKLDDISLLTDKELEELSLWNERGTDYPSEESLSSLFEEQTTINPKEIAILMGDENLTYEQLNRRVNRLAHWLTMQGVEHEVPVAVAMRRSVSFVVTILAVIKAGGTYVPIEPSFPSDRIRFILEDSRSLLLLTDDLNLDEAPLPVVNVNNVDVDSFPEFNLDIFLPQANSLAYIMYTSGSTDKPKGVMVEHRNVVRLVKNTNYVQFQTGDRILMTGAVGFDASTFEIWGALLNGLTLILVEEDVLLDADKLSLAMDHYSITTMWLTSPLFNMFAQQKPDMFKPIRQLLVGGDVLSVKHLAMVKEQCNEITIINGYGPTENTTFSCCMTIDNMEGDTVPIGQPISNSTAYILDDKLRLLPIGVKGELWVGGDGVARGYLNLPELNRQCFVSDPFRPGQRMYKTGDWAKRLPDGTIEYLGRMDYQVKVRGYRVDLGEIESFLNKHKDVEQSVVITSSDSTGNHRIEVFYTLKEGSLVEETSLRQYAKEGLPNYMVPTVWRRLDNFILNQNGKIDRNKLHSFKENSQVTTKKINLTNQTDLERGILNIWKELLQVDSIGIHENFFDLGAHSLLMLRAQELITKELNVTLSVLDLFQYPTIHELTKYLNKQTVETVGNNTLHKVESIQTSNKIAIIGMSGRFPGAANVEVFWNNLSNGIESISQLDDGQLIASGIDPTVFQTPNYVKARGVLDNVEMFDAEFFGFSKREAELLDPQQRFFLECSWEALESAGYNPDQYSGKIGVFAGSTMSTYFLKNVLTNPKIVESVGGLQAFISNDKDFLATRAAYKLNLHGPAVSVNTACSTSLVGVHMACESLLRYESDMALAGGVSISVPQVEGYLYQEGGITSKDGHCRAFDEQAGGTVSGSGVGVVVLKRLEEAMRDGDTVYSVITGSAINNDGSRKVGFTAPSVEGQASVIADALEKAGAHPDTITYVEAHGTATALGDPIEMLALQQVFKQKTDRQRYCAIGSLKTNIGHLDAAAGVASLIKTSLSLHRKKMVPSLHYKSPNKKINMEDSPFYVNTSYKDWEQYSGVPRRAGVSSFGIGGTNAHVVVEEAPSITTDKHIRQWVIMPLSAKTETALEVITENISEHLLHYPELEPADVAYTLQMGRKNFNFRRFAVVSTNKKDMVDWSEKVCLDEHVKPIVFRFDGNAMSMDTSKQLYLSENLFRTEVELYIDYLEEQHQYLFPLKELWDKQHDKESWQPLNRELFAFITEQAMTKWLLLWGIEPQFVIGHGLGELSACCCSGLITWQEALSFILHKNKKSSELQQYDVIEVQATVDMLTLFADKGLTMKEQSGVTIVAGVDEELRMFEAQLKKQKLFYRHNKIKYFDSTIFTWNSVGTKALIPFYSTLTEQWYKSEETVESLNEAGYWAQYAAMVEEKYAYDSESNIRDEKAYILKGESAESGQVVVDINCSVESDPQRALMLILGELWAQGVNVDWSAGYEAEIRRRVALPTYPFERKRYWLEEPKIIPKKEESIVSAKSVSEPVLEQEIINSNDITGKLIEIWRDLFGKAEIGLHDDFFELGGDSLLAVNLLSRMNDTFELNMKMDHFFNEPTILGILKKIQQSIISTIGAKPEVQDIRIKDLKRTDFLDSVSIRSLRKNQRRNGPGQPGHSVLLTGATGFLGTHLLHELLSSTGSTIYCLVRAKNDTEALQRITSSLQNHRLWNQEYVDRIIPVEGDLCKPLFGLSNQQYMQLASIIDDIIHNGAMVNHVYPYSVLRAANVEGTIEIVQFACTDSLKPVHFISTLAVFGQEALTPNELVYEHSKLPDLSRLPGGYAQTKWVAEQLLEEARSKGVPVSIYRPGNISGSSRNGISNDDNLSRMMRASIQFRAIVEFEQDIAIDFTPVDFVAQAIIQIVTAGREVFKNYHLVNPNPLSMKDIGEKMLSLYPDMQKMPYETWKQTIKQELTNRPDHPMFTLIEMMDRMDSPRYGFIFNAQNTLQVLEEGEVSYPLVDSELFKKYLKYYELIGDYDINKSVIL